MILSNPNLLTTAQAATELGVTARQVQALIKSGRLPAVRIGRDWILRRADLEAYQPRRRGRPSKEEKT